MKPVRKIFSILLIFVFLISLAACGSNPPKTEEVSGDQETAASDSINSNPAPVDTANANTTAPDAKAGIDSILGEWTDISDSTRFAKISASGPSYAYTDNDGTYSALFNEGMLEVKVSDTDSANVYYDDKAGNLILDYNGDVTKFKRK